MSYRRKRSYHSGAKVEGALAVIVIAVMLVPLAIFGTNSFNYMANRHVVTGVVEAPVTSKMRISGSSDSISGSEKYAVRIDGSIYNCTNTQCSQLQVGDRVQLSCYKVWHLFTPDEQ